MYRIPSTFSEFGEVWRALGVLIVYGYWKMVSFDVDKG